ncbi:MAG: HD domain-containing protein [Deltaproteobacteria bacterium]|nr:HD domain-containing protein [Deltaproteobacteria bacterium]
MDDLRTELISLLGALDGVAQSPVYHPEGDALFHSLQVFECALAGTQDPLVLAAALLHDVGKAVDGAHHEAEGAALLDGLVDQQICWLVAHHLDLLRAPERTRRKLRHDPRLSQLVLLRRFDLAGRDPHASVRTVGWAVDKLLSVAHTSRIAHALHAGDHEPVMSVLLDDLQVTTQVKGGHG